jgi:predicted SAM-dependent methyltransferase
MSGLKLHIGGKQAHPDWKIINIEPLPEVDFVCDASKLDRFEDNSVAIIYASHVLEHFYYGIDNELVNTLKEWRRVLEPGGQLLVSVPDLRTLCWLYNDPKLEISQRHHLMRIMFGGQTNQYDVHKVGLDEEILGYYAAEAGFSDYSNVEEFGLFDDCSIIKFMGVLISLNAILTK